MGQYYVYLLIKDFYELFYGYYYSFKVRWRKVIYRLGKMSLRGEEGLDSPSAKKVIFFKPQNSQNVLTEEIFSVLWNVGSPLFLSSV